MPFLQVVCVRSKPSQALWILFAPRSRKPVTICPSRRLGMFNLLFFLLSDALHAHCRSFLRALMFCRSSQYINTARIDPALLYVENSRLRIKDKKTLAVCVMTGTLTESYLIGSSEAGPRHSPYSIHKVTIAPLEQEMRRDASVWGLLFDFRVITGMMSPAGFGFATRGEGKGDGWNTGVCGYSSS
jgi:hypothetical protein